MREEAEATAVCLWAIGRLKVDNCVRIPCSFYTYPVSNDIFIVFVFFSLPFSIAYSIQGQNVQMISPSSDSHQQVVAVGQPLALQPQGTVMVEYIYFSFLCSVMQVSGGKRYSFLFGRTLLLYFVSLQLTAKNIQCMRTLLNLAHCHGGYLGTSWQLVLATLQVMQLCCCKVS